MCVYTFVCVCVCMCDLYDCLRLLAFVHHVQLSSAVPFIVSDVDGDLRGLQPLEAVALTATPLVDFLQEMRRILRSWKL